MLRKVNRFEDLAGYLAIQRQHFQIFYSNSMRNAGRILLIFRVHGWKKSSLDRAANRLVQSGVVSNGRVIIGLGKAKVAANGKGEMSVPTCQMKTAIGRAVKCANLTAEQNGLDCKISMVGIDEFRTTQRCSRCFSKCERQKVWKKRKRHTRRDKPRSNPTQVTNISY